jgi:pimeloyl-ACP methyl ester carboxylesterase
MTTTEELTRKQTDFGSQLTADNRSVEIEGETFVYRRFRNAAALAPPLVFLTDRLPNAQLRIYPDANHGFLDQYPELFADHVNAFLN